MRIRDIWPLLRASAAGWNADNSMRLSAALAYYSVFSMAPVLIIAISVAGIIYGEDAARGRVAAQLQDLAGIRTAEAIQALLVSAAQRTASYSATIVGLAMLFFGASGVFMELKDALNTIWGVEIKPGNALVRIARGRVISLLAVLCVGLFFLMSLLVSAGLAAFGDVLRERVALPGFFWQATDLALSMGITTVLFAIIFKVLPNVILRWRDVLAGAICAAFLFTIGKFLIGFYLGKSGVASYYGAAGSAMVILIWVYYSACILFFGAEFTKAWVMRYGKGVVADKWAVVKRIDN